MFEVEISNIPVVNLRQEYEEYMALLSDNEFVEKLYKCYNEPIVVPNIVWSGMPCDLITLMIQRSLLGLESYIGAAVEYELTKRELLTNELAEKLLDPFSLGGRGTVENLYVKMPGLIENQFELSVSDPELYTRTKSYYKKIRNPVFHGNQLRVNRSQHAVVSELFQQIRDLYSWIDTWFTAFPGGWRSVL